jgi:hypothetical protein
MGFVPWVFGYDTETVQYSSRLKTAVVTFVKSQVGGGGVITNSSSQTKLLSTDVLHSLWY